HLREWRQSGQALAFGPDGPDLVVRWGDTWPELCRRLPHAWQPDFVLLCLAYTRTPPDFAAAPIPVIGYAPDWPILWHAYRQQATWCDRLWTDAAGARHWAAAGSGRVRGGPPFRGAPGDLGGARPVSPRDL